MAAKSTSPPPAYFLSLSLENVRSFGEKQTISFAREDGRPAQWTIILGDNGVGKTTVLKSLAIMRPLDDSGTIGLSLHIQAGKYTPGGKRLNNWPLFRGQHEQQLSKDEIHKMYEYAAHMSYKAVIGCSLIEFKTSKNPQYYKIEDLHDVLPQLIPHTYFSEPINKVFIENPEQKEEIDDRGICCYGYGAGRATGNSTLSESPNTIGTCVSLFDDRADLLNPEEWFLQMEYSSLKQDKQAAKSLEQVRQVLLKVLPDVTDIEINSKNHQQYLELQTPYGWVRLRDMSLGYQTLVVWLTDFASKLFIRYPDSKNPLEEPAIVLIDEIDLHLHPSWQRKLIKFLSDIFKNTQFIATAHSPLVVQAAGDAGANVVLLKREGDQTVVVQHLPDVRAWRVEQILNSELFDTPPLSPQTEADLTRRNELLLKKRLTKAEKAELTRLEADVEALPAGNTKAEQRADSLLARLSRNLTPDDL